MRFLSFNKFARFVLMCCQLQEHEFNLINKVSLKSNCFLIQKILTQLNSVGVKSIFWLHMLNCEIMF